MKKIVLFILLLNSVCVFSQITERTIKSKPQNVIIEKYDTLTNFPKLELLIGQSIYMLPIDVTHYNTDTVYDCFKCKNILLKKK
jgi:hypothetical protein